MASLSIPISSDGELKVKSEYCVVDETEKKEMTSESDGDGKKQKQRGRNKDRPPPMKFSRGERLCPIFIDVSPEREKWPECTYPGVCSFQHDVDKYLASKPPDLGQECFVFKQYGRCRRGVTCRFAESHVTRDEMNRVRNKVDRDLAANFGSLRIREKNHLDKDLQNQLRKKSYDFSKADKIVDHFFKLRDARMKETDCPPEKKAKLEESGGCDDAKESNGVAKDIEIDESKAEHFDETSSKNKIDWKDKLYLAPLTTVGNMPFRRICKEFGVDITCGEMAMGTQLLQAHAPEWALVQRHHSEDLFGIQICGSNPQQMTRIAQLVQDGHIDCDFIDLNLGTSFMLAYNQAEPCQAIAVVSKVDDKEHDFVQGCPIDLIYKRGMGSGLMDRRKPLEVMVKSMSAAMTRPVTLKMRTGIYMDKRLAHTLIPSLKEWGISQITVHGRSREQRYTKLADWNYIAECSELAHPVPLFGNGDIINYEDYYMLKEGSKVDGIMIARGALIKPWVFTEIKERRHWDISAQERLDMIRKYANYGMEHWGSDDKGVETTRRFLLEWLSFLHRYVPHGIVESPPQRMNDRVPVYRARSDLETLLSSPACSDWIKITEMFLGKVPDGFAFAPKHRANGY